MKTLDILTTCAAKSPLSRGYTSDFLLTLVMGFFQTLSRRQRDMKIARVATLELATRRVKNSQEKVARVETFATKSQR